MTNVKGLTFIVSDKCNITCDFCGPDCGPDKKGNLNALDMIKIYEDQKSTIGVSNVVFTGGEPTLFMNDILSTIKHISSDKISVRIVTNAFWGKSEGLAEKFVSNLKAAGLTEFNFSVDDFHQEYIDLKSIKTAIEVVKKHKIPTLLAFKTYPGSRLSKQSFDDLLGYEIPFLEDVINDDFFIAFSQGKTVPLGRKSDSVDKDSWYKFGDPNSWKGPCSEVFRNITIQPNRMMSPCCGIVDRKMSEFYFKDPIQSDFSEILQEADTSLLYNWLATEGPEGIMNFIKKHTDVENYFTDRYVQNCHLCQSIFSNPDFKPIISKGLKEKSHEIAQKRKWMDVQYDEIFKK